MYSLTKHRIHFLIKIDKNLEKKRFSSYHERGTKKKFLSPHEESNLKPSDSALRFSLIFLFTNMTLSTLLILAVCRTCVI